MKKLSSLLIGLALSSNANALETFETVTDESLNLIQCAITTSALDKTDETKALLAAIGYRVEMQTTMYYMGYFTSSFEIKHSQHSNMYDVSYKALDCSSKVETAYNSLVKEFLREQG